MQHTNIVNRWKYRVRLNWTCLALVGAGMLQAKTGAAQAPPQGGEPGRVQATQDPTADNRFAEQERRLRELEERLRMMESMIPHGTPTGLGTSPANAQQEEPVDKEYDRDIKEKHRLLTGNELVSEQFPGSWPMFGTEMRMKIGGYTKVDFVYDVNGTRDPNQFLMSTIPVPGSPGYEDGGYFTAFAKETRLNIDVRKTTTGEIPLRMFVEGDFFSNSSQFRLRHAYITADDFLFGQTWTTLSFLESLPFLIDFAAGDALFGGRSTQIRYQKRVSDGWKLAVGIENSPEGGIENANGFEGRARGQFPLLALRADYRWTSGVLFLGTSVAQLRWDGGATGPNDTAIQTDFVIAGRQHLGSDYCTWNFSYGNGSGENILAFAGSNANAVLTPAGNLDRMRAFSGVLGYGHKWSDEFSSNLSFAYGWLDTPDSRAALALKRGGIWHANLIWNMTNQFSTGIEYMYGAQRTQNDAKGEASRIQLMVKFEF